MSDPRHLFLVCYDIRDPARLRTVYKTMRGFGDHVQYSVFRCPLSEIQLARLRERLLQVIAPTEDQVIIVRLGRLGTARAWPVEVIGQAMDLPDDVVRIIG